MAEDKLVPRCPSGDDQNKVRYALFYQIYFFGSTVFLGRSQQHAPERNRTQNNSFFVADLSEP